MLLCFLVWTMNFVNYKNLRRKFRTQPPQFLLNENLNTDKITISQTHLLASTESYDRIRSQVGRYDLCWRPITTLKRLQQRPRKQYVRWWHKNYVDKLWPCVHYWVAEINELMHPGLCMRSFIIQKLDYKRIQNWKNSKFKLCFVTLNSFNFEFIWSSRGTSKMQI